MATVDVEELMSISGIQWLHPPNIPSWTYSAFHLRQWDDDPDLVSLRPASRHCEEKLDILGIASQEMGELLT